MKKESEWKPIPGYDGGYEINKKGNVKSLKRLKPFIMSQNFTKTGYPYVVLCHKGKRKLRPVHILVMHTFCGDNKFSDSCQINHKDGDKTNSNLNNLEWCDQYYNMQHARDTGLLGVCIINMDIANEIRKKYIYDNARIPYLSVEYGISKAEVRCILKNKRWKTDDPVLTNIKIVSLAEKRKIARQIRIDDEQGLSRQALSDKYNISKASICRIINYKQRCRENERKAGKNST